MTVGSFKAKRSGECSFHECGRKFEPGDQIWFKTKASGYFCSDRCLIECYPDEKDACEKHLEKLEVYRKNLEIERNLHLASSTRPQVTITGDMRQAEISQAHIENLKSARETRDMTATLVASVLKLNTTLESIEKEMSVMITVMRKFIPPEEMKR